MAKGKDREVFPAPDREKPHRALLFEIKGKRDMESGASASVYSEMFAALSLEEVVAYVRTRQPNVEIVELKALGTIQVLSSSEHLA